MLLDMFQEFLLFLVFLFAFLAGSSHLFSVFAYGDGAGFVSPTDFSIHVIEDSEIDRDLNGDWEVIKDAEDDW